jgi:hypothetical protein
LPVDKRSIEVSMSLLTLVAEAAAIKAPVFVAIAWVMLWAGRGMDWPADTYLAGLMIMAALPIAWPCISLSGLLRPTPGASAMGGW